MNDRTISPRRQLRGTLPEDSAESAHWGFIVPFILALFGSYVAIITPSVISVALRVQQIDPNGKVGSLSLVLSAGAICAVIANPLFGKLSDRTTSRLGMRRPWMILGLIGGLIGLFVVATAQSIVMLLVGWCITQAMFNALLATLVALLPDHVPAARRGMVGGLMGICYPAAVIVGTWIASGLASTSAFWMIMGPSAPAIILVLLLCATLKDRRLAPEDRPAWSFTEFARTFWFNPRRHPDFSWALVAIFLTGAAMMTLTTYQVYYLSDSIGIFEDDLPGVTSTLNSLVFGTAIATSLISGWIADRFQRRRFYFIVAGLVMAVGLLTTLFADSLSFLYIGVAIIGLGTGFYFSGHYTVPALVLPSDDDAAKDMGIVNIAVTIPSSLVPVYGPLLLGLGTQNQDNYVALFISGAVLAILAVPASRRIRGVT